MKKAILVSAVIVGIAFVGFQAASAHMGGRGMIGQGNGGYGNCPQGQGTASQLSEADQKALETFQAETKAIRKELVVKYAELRALQSQDNPDAKKIGALTGKIFDLKTTLAGKAKAAGITTAGAWCPNGGPGMKGRGHMGGSYGPGMHRGMMGGNYGPGTMMGTR